jgi:hypothetical protein
METLWTLFGGSIFACSFLSLTIAALPRKTLCVIPFLAVFECLESGIVIGQLFRRSLPRHEWLIVSQKLFHLGHDSPHLKNFLTLDSSPLRLSNWTWWSVTNASLRQRRWS